VVSYLVPEIEVSYWDYQGRVSYRLNARDTLTLFGLGSYDFLASEGDDGDSETVYDILFHRLDLRWDRMLSGDSDLHTSLTLGRDRTVGDDERFRVTGDSVRLSLIHDHRTSSGTRYETGADAKLLRYEFGVTNEENEGVFVFEGDENAAEFFSTRSDIQTGFYSSLVLDAGSGVSVMPGFRFDLYHSEGQTWLAPEPRLRARFQVRDDLALVHGFGISHQAPSYGVPIPGLEPDLKGGLQRSFQNDAGVELALPSDFHFTATFFQNLFFDMTDDLGVSRLDNEVSNDVGALLPRTFGRAVGLEFYLSRSLTRDLGGYVSYTLSRSDRVLGRAEGPSTFDRRHVFNAALSYDLGKRWRAGARTTFYTGIPADVWYARAAKDPPRTRPFYRLDWRVEKSWLLGNGGAFWSLVFEVLNTTLNKEELEASCYAYGCRRERIGPVTLPSVGLEAAF
jgi:hypothetical protein